MAIIALILSIVKNSSNKNTDSTDLFLISGAISAYNAAQVGIRHIAPKVKPPARTYERKDDPCLKPGNMDQAKCKKKIIPGYNERSPPGNRKPKHWPDCPGWQCGIKAPSSKKIYVPYFGKKVSKYLPGDTCGNYVCKDCDTWVNNSLPDGKNRARWHVNNWTNHTEGVCDDKSNNTGGRRSGGS